MAVCLRKKGKRQDIFKEQINEILHTPKKKIECILKDKQKTEQMLEKVYTFCNKMSNFPVMGEAFSEIPWVCMLISDYVNGFYREIPTATLVTLTAAVLYIVSPIDLLLDAVPVLGQIDDWAVLGLALKAARNDLNSYKQWKLNEEEEDE